MSLCRYVCKVLDTFWVSKLYTQHSQLIIYLEASNEFPTVKPGDDINLVHPEKDFRLVTTVNHANWAVKWMSHNNGNIYALHLNGFEQLYDFTGWSAELIPRSL